MGWPQWMLALEYDGVEFHPEDRADHDSSRRDWITARGWVVRAYRNTDIFTTSQAFEHEVMGLVQTSRRRWRGTLGASICHAAAHSARESVAQVRTRQEGLGRRVGVQCPANAVGTLEQ
jgi:hypothetical protein